MKQYNFIHYTDWCDYHEILDAYGNLSDDIHVTFIHERTDNINPILNFLYTIQKSRKINKVFPIRNIAVLNRWLAKEYIPGEPNPNDTCLIYSSLYAANLHQSYWDFLRAKGFKLVLVYVDKTSLTPSLMDVDELRQHFDLICTYNESEASLYNIETHPIYMPDLSTFRNDDIRTDVLFIGSEKGRIDKINKIYDLCTSIGLRCSFYVAGYQGPEMRDGINYISKIPYKETLERTSHTKAVVNLMQSGAYGITMRDVEAYNLGVYMITDNSDRRLGDLFEDEQCIRLDDVQLLQKLSILKKPFRRFGKKPTPFSYDSFYTWINEKIQ